MKVPEHLRYTESHEWVEMMEDGTARVGLTDHAQHELGDLVFINLPEAGDTVTRGESFADVESVKAVSDVYGPLSGMVAEINEAVSADPALINSDPYGAWLVRLENPAGVDELLDAAAYARILGEG